MNQMTPIFNSSALTMSSHEIAELVDSRHDSVKRTIERLVERGVIENPPTVEISTPTKPITAYSIGKRDSYVVVAQLSPEFTARLVDRWQELEQQASAFQIPTTLSGALRLAAEQADQIEEQQRLIRLQAPAVEFVERFVEAKSARSLREVAKVLGLKERDFINRLIKEGIVFRQSGNLLPYAQYHHKGYFAVKTGAANGHAFQQTRFTPVGINWISRRFGLVGGNAA